MNINKIDELIAKIETKMNELDGIKPKETYILLDDDKHFRDLLSIHLGGNGVNVQSVGTTEEFKAVLKSNGCTRLVIDVMLDRENGIDLAEALKLNEISEDIIFISGNDLPTEMMDRVNGMGARFINKDDDIFNKLRS